MDVAVDVDAVEGSVAVAATDDSAEESIGSAVSGGEVASTMSTEASRLFASSSIGSGVAGVPSGPVSKVVFGGSSDFNRFAGDWDREGGFLLVGLVDGPR